MLAILRIKLKPLQNEQGRKTLSSDTDERRSTRGLRQKLWLVVQQNPPQILQRSNDLTISVGENFIRI